MFKEYIQPIGDLQVYLYDKNGNLKNCFDTNNLVVTAGKDFIASLLAQDTNQTRMSHMSIGSSTATPAVANITLGTELARVAFSGPAVLTGNTVTYSTTFDPGVGTGPIVEAGIFNASSGGTMLCRTVFPIVTKMVDDTLTIHWKITIS